jgi:hypothetical protein
MELVMHSGGAGALIFIGTSFAGSVERSNAFAALGIERWISTPLYRDPTLDGGLLIYRSMWSAIAAVVTLHKRSTLRSVLS